MATTLKQFVDDFEVIIKKGQLNMALKLAKGQCATMEQYKREVGRIEGMVLAVQTARDMLKAGEFSLTDNELPEMPAESAL